VLNPLQQALPVMSKHAKLRAAQRLPRHIDLDRLLRHGETIDEGIWFSRKATLAVIDEIDRRIRRLRRDGGGRCDLVAELKRERAAVERLQDVALIVEDGCGVTLQRVTRRWKERRFARQAARYRGSVN